MSRAVVVTLALAINACQPGAKSDSVQAPGPTPPDPGTKAGEIATGTTPQPAAPSASPGGSNLAEGAPMTVDVLPVGVIGLETGAGLALTTADPLVGQAGKADLESMKYFFTRIMICKSIEPTGTGYNNPEGCIDIYAFEPADGGDTEAFYQAFDVAAAEQHYAAKPELWVDLMARGDMKKKLFPAGKEFRLLSGEQKLAEHKKQKPQEPIPDGVVPEGDEGEYNFAVVNWMKPIRLKAKLPIGTKTLYTRKGALKVETSGVDNFQHRYVEAPDLATPGPDGKAEEITFMHNNGGSWFKFSKPIVITKEDIAAKKPFDLNLVFDPEGLIKGTTNRGTIGGTNVVVADPSGNGIIAPFLSLTPLLAAKGDLYREHYRGSFAGNGSVGPYDITIDLYYLGSDGTKAIIGVGNQVHFTPASTATTQYNWYPLFGAVEGMDGKLALRSHRAPVIEGLTRLSMEGATGQLKACERLYIEVPENQPVPTPQCPLVSIDYKLEDVAVVNP